MTAGPGSAPTALIVDDDVAFVLWLGELFSESGYQAFPALQFSEAVTLAQTLTAPVDVLVANPKLSGAARAIDTLKNAQPNLRVLLIRDPADDDSTAPFDHATLVRPSAWEPISKELWMMKIRNVLMRLSAAT